MPIRAEQTTPMRDQGQVMEKLISSVQQQAQRTVQGFSQTFGTPPASQQRTSRQQPRFGTNWMFER
jgi:hypothetical protein